MLLFGFLRLHAKTPLKDRPTSRRNHPRSISFIRIFKSFFYNEAGQRQVQGSYMILLTPSLSQIDWILRFLSLFTYFILIIFFRRHQSFYSFHLALRPKLPLIKNKNVFFEKISTLMFESIFMLVYFLPTITTRNAGKNGNFATIPRPNWR